uniref:Protein FAR1-RELATED SEQUENCE n=1 Tax=Fagus sylvatica TaxID=28930 RepID=A0A2N9I0H1_FAGSY
MESYHHFHIILRRMSGWLSYMRNGSDGFLAFLNSNFFAGMSIRLEKKILSDFECFKGKLECSSSSPMEKQFQEAYTHEIFKRECVTVLPDRYILDRWRKDIKRKHTYVSTCTDDVQHNPVLERYEKLHRLAVGVLEIGAESVENFNVLEKTEVVRSPMVVKRKGRPRMKRLKSSMEEAVSKPKKKRNTAAARNLAHSTSTTGVGGSAYGDWLYIKHVSMPHSNDGVIHLTNPMPSQSFVSESMSQTQAHGNEDQALNLP